MALNKEIVQNRIEKRSILMLQNGVIEEAKNLAKRYGWDHESMTGPAYKAARLCFENNEDTSLWFDANLRGEMMLVKKQMTWFRRDPYIYWIEDPTKAFGLVEQFLA